jgi:diguanylate cyclase (GGDEF)-like protein
MANREAAMSHLERVLGQPGSVRVLYVDLDDFKLVNDTLGHAAGDELLGRVAAAMQALARSGELIGRQGGDEFVFVAVDRDDIDALAAELRTVITRPVSLQGLEVSVGVSIGIAGFPADGDSAAALLESADGAMYEAKRSGRNEIRHARKDQWRDREQERAALAFTTELPHAIEHDELLLHWQPLVDVDDLTVVGLEALVRWNHPRRGLLYPDAFLPFAIKTGIITEVDGWVASAVSRQRLAWRKQRLDPYVGFNLASQYAHRPGALEALLGRLTVDGLDLEHVTIELPESQMLREDQNLVAFLRGLHDAGVTVSLDDFGHAYSSLNRLGDVPARWVKLHRGFLAGAPEDPASTRVFVAVLDLLRALELEFIAEGVEREAQRTLLQRHGVRIAQGFLLGRPVPAEQLYERLRESAPSQLAVSERRVA